jgi:ribonuclease G
LNNELVISASTQGTRIALLQEKRLAEYHLEESESSFAVGDIYLGTVRKLSTGSNAAFVDIGYEKDAFLHYHDLGHNVRSLNKMTKEVIAKRLKGGRLNNFKLEPEIDKHDKIDKVLDKNQPILVQVIKEPISTKGPRLSCDISIAGRYAVLVPFSNSVNISKKITDKAERSRLLKLMSSVKPANFGIIVRTVAEGRDLDDLDRDIKASISKWELGMATLQDAKPKDRIVSEMNRTSSILRDLLNDSFDSITVDTKEMFDEIRDFLKAIAPDKEKILKLYNGKNKLFEQFGIEKQIKSLFGRSVSLSGGGYLIIEHTEALHVIDVNSGNRSNTEDNQEDTALHTNIEAAKEIARQIRLRDIGGIIVIDFIDMKKAEHKKEIYDAMKEIMKPDRSKYTILPLTKFGLMQITRQRVRPELNIVTREACPTCNGLGTIQPSILVTDVIESNLEYLMTKQNEGGITIILHPYLHAYFTKGLPSIRMRWFMKYKKWITLLKDSSFGMTDFKFYDKNEEEIEITTQL